MKNAIKTSILHKQVMVPSSSVVCRICKCRAIRNKNVVAFFTPSCIWNTSSNNIHPNFFLIIWINYCFSLIIDNFFKIQKSKFMQLNLHCLDELKMWSIINWIQFRTNIMIDLPVKSPKRKLSLLSKVQRSYTIYVIVLNIYTY